MLPCMMTGATALAPGGEPSQSAPQPASRAGSGAGTFRGEFAAASLKLPRLGRGGGGRNLFPRRIRCGLIEARPAGRSGPGFFNPFRGEFAAASLKRDEDRIGGDIVAPFPRRIRRGLIEATPWTRCSPLQALSSLASLAPWRDHSFSSFLLFFFSSSCLCAFVREFLYFLASWCDRDRARGGRRPPPRAAQRPTHG